MSAPRPAPIEVIKVRRITDAGNLKAFTAATDWQKMLAFAAEKGWQADLTPSGRVRLKKDASVVFGPGPDASNAAIADCVHRLGYVDGFMKACRSRRP
jgi:hypothetical protein